jgi:RNA-directed DNA polymerase
MRLTWCRGANTAGVDGVTVTDVEARLGVPGFLDDLRSAVKDDSFRPLPVRERMIPSPARRESSDAWVSRRSLTGWSRRR